jgi:hypothetical protein
MLIFYWDQREDYQSGPKYSERDFDRPACILLLNDYWVELNLVQNFQSACQPNVLKKGENLTVYPVFCVENFGPDSSM